MLAIALGDLVAVIGGSPQPPASRPPLEFPEPEKQTPPPQLPKLDLWDTLRNDRG